MNLLKQTALILGLTSLSIGSWSLYCNWRNRISILFSIFCLVVSVWALSFVSHTILVGRISYDIHLICNVLLSPIVILILSKILLKKEDVFSEVLSTIAMVGAVVLVAIIAFSIERGWIVDRLIDFWPGFILIELLYIMIQDFILGGAINTDYISPSKKVIFYLGLGLSLSLCSFDRIEFLGYTIPALGNLLFTIYLVFTSQVITPQKILGIEALVSRFFATVTLALIITGFFALLYDYISETFPLFLLNSFLISFAVLMMWNPLVTFFRYVARELLKSESEMQLRNLAELKIAISISTDLKVLQNLVGETFKIWLNAAKVELVYEKHGLKLPEKVMEYFEYLSQRKITPLLHLEIIKMEREQVLTQERKQELDLLIQILDHYQTDLIFPIFYNRDVIALVLVRAETTIDEWNLNVSRYSKLSEVIQELGPTLTRLSQIEEAKERDRLVLMGEMAAGLAHEVRNPLGAIRGAAELMGEASGPWARVIQEEVSRLNRLVSQFLDFAHDPKDQQEVVDLNEILKTAIQNIRGSLPSIPEIDFKGAPKKVLVKVVPDHLQQILLNLVQNAIKAAQGTALPKISIRIFDVGFEVADNGVGMTSEILEKVFQPFFTSFKDGSGLGLSICQRLVHFNEGKITIVSTPHVGTRVTVQFNPVTGSEGLK